MDFRVEKDPDTIPCAFSQILDTCINGITLSDPDQPDNPIVYANEAFELITGHDRDEIIGRNYRWHERPVSCRLLPLVGCYARSPHGLVTAFPSQTHDRQRPA